MIGPATAYLSKAVSFRNMPRAPPSTLTTLLLSSCGCQHPYLKKDGQIC